MRFNPPPNWPVPPGWNPPPGWMPDPSWGPVPAGWQLWVDDSAATAAYGPSMPQYPVSGSQWAPGPTGYYGPPPSNKTRNILIAVGIGLVVVIAVVLTLVFTLGGPESDEDQIRGAIRGIESTWNNNDYKGFKSHFCNKRANKMTEKDFTSDRDDEGRLTITIKSIKVRGDNADAEVIIDTSNSSTTTKTTTSSSNDKTDTMKFVKEDGKWLWCGMSSS